MLKICSECETEKPIDDFYFANKNRTTRYSRCKKCHNQRRKQWFGASIEYQRDYQRSKYQEFRDKIVEVLGGKCAQCGYDENILGLDIDHIENDGNLERKNRKGTNVTMLRKWLANDCKGLQLLCGTCHNIKSRTSR